MISGPLFASEPALEPQAAWSPPELLLELGDDDGELIHELVEAFRADTEPRLQRLRALLTSGDIVSARAEAHTIKGSAKQMGVSRMAAISEDMEMSPLSPAAGAMQELLDCLEREFALACDGMANYCRHGL